MPLFSYMYFVRFLMPGEAGEAMADTPWYGFDFGPVHFTVISTEHDFTAGSKQVCLALDRSIR